MENVAAIIVDQQNTFIPENEGGTGELGVTNGGKIIEYINPFIEQVKQKGGIIVGSKDWHEVGHISFASSFEGIPVYSELTYEDVKDWTDTDNKLSA
ncbi:hypothetical protein MK079_03110, partial [Candidatus Gracilibacteria bacterium]|nr:hypothetical protein [Candidatus Gracilibacteria bacterium]